LEAVFEKSHSLNTAISGLMKLTNALQKASADCANVRADVHILVRLLVPFAPYFAHEAASVLGMPLKDVREWPQGQEITAAAKTLYVLQINGKTRDTFDVDEQVDDAQELAVTQVKDRFKDKTVIIKKIIQPAAAKIVNVICDVQE
jgi:leucyl-tRNA synthetase